MPADGWGRDVMFPGYLDQADLPAIYTAERPVPVSVEPGGVSDSAHRGDGCGVPIVTSTVNGLAGDCRRRGGAGRSAAIRTRSPLPSGESSRSAELRR